MGASHHDSGDRPQQSSPEIDKIMQRFNEQIEGRAKREYSKGRLGPHDQGEVAMAIAADKAHNRIIIDFGKPVVWMGLTTEQANGLINLLKERILELGSPVVIS